MHAGIQVIEWYIFSLLGFRLLATEFLASVLIRQAITAAKGPVHLIDTIWQIIFLHNESKIKIYKTFYGQYCQYQTFMTS